MRLHSIGKRGRLFTGITSGDTTIVSDGFADLPVVVSPDYLMLALDPTQAAGDVEIVKVTAHTSASTSVTVERAQETEYGGSSARSHSSDTLWYHVITPGDLTGVVVVADQTEREALSVSEGTIVWQDDTNEHWTYVDSATPYWQQVGSGGGTLNQERFDATGSEQTWQVPTGVTSVLVEAVGATGGFNSSSYAGPTSWEFMQHPAKVTGFIATTPGDTLYVNVGEMGAAGTAGAGGAGGFPDGGDGAKGAGGGGGSSDVRTVSGDASTRLIVAAGSGGSGANNSGTYGWGGRGGIPIGETGFYDVSNVGTGVSGGGATTSAGGAGGTGGGTGTDGSDGGLASGGDGGAAGDGARGGGGGGGGYYGGGGGEGGQTVGDCGGGGGGGSSLIPTNGTAELLVRLDASDGHIILSWVE